MGIAQISEMQNPKDSCIEYIFLKKELYANSNNHLPTRNEYCKYMLTSILPESFFKIHCKPCTFS